MTTELGIRYTHPVTGARVYRWANEHGRVSLPVTIGQPSRSADASSPEALLADLATFEAEQPDLVLSIALEPVSRTFEVQRVTPPLPRTIGSVIEATVHGQRERLVLTAHPEDDERPWFRIPALLWTYESDLSGADVLWEAPPL